MLLSQPYLKVPFAIDRGAVMQAVDAFMTFLDEPESVKSQINYTVNLDSRRGEVGYFARDPKDDIYNDRKAFFHYHASIQERYAEFLAANPVVANFMKKAAPIWQAAHDAGREFITQFEAESPGITARFFDRDEPEILLRFLKYDWQSAGKYLAKPHYDAGSFTLAIAESDPGLRIGFDDSDLREVVHQENEAMFMLSNNFPLQFNHQNYRPAWHDVVQMNEEGIGKSCSRWALVCFFEAAGMKAVSRSETHRVKKMII